jgi:hypothetical protein
MSGAGYLERQAWILWSKMWTGLMGEDVGRIIPNQDLSILKKL